MEDKDQYWTVVDTDHFEFNVSTEPYTMALGVTIKPTSFTGGKANNMCVFIDIVFFTLEFEFRWKING